MLEQKVNSKDGRLSKLSGSCHEIFFWNSEAALPSFFYQAPLFPFKNSCHIGSYPHTRPTELPYRGRRTSLVLRGFAPRYLFILSHSVLDHTSLLCH
jgi:hypothetical protein